MRASWRAGLWRLADPKVSLASIAGLVLGSALAAADGPLHGVWLALAVAGILAIETAKNASGEVVDWDSGDDLGVDESDRSPFSGGKRVLVEGLLTRRETWTIAAAGYALGAGAGLAIVLGREPRVLAIGLGGLALAWLYHGPPLRLSYRGLGEIAVAVAYGPLVTAGAYLVQRGTIPARVVAASIPLGLLVAAFLWINEFPDYRADLAAGKRTLVVRLGRVRASRAFAGIIALALAAAVCLPWLGLPRLTWLGLLAALPAARAVITLRRWPEHTARIIPAQAATLASFLLYAVGAGLGAWLGRP